MNFFELNKLAAGLLVALLLMTGVRLLADRLYEPSHAPATHAAIATPPPSRPAAQAAPPVDFMALLAGADLARGERVARKCTACHTFTKDGPNRIGPNLWEVVGRPIAEHEGFRYSSALEGLKGQTWDIDALNAFLEKPRTYARGTSMSFAGLRKPQDRANLIAYLRSLSDSPP